MGSHFTADDIEQWWVQYPIALSWNVPHDHDQLEAALKSRNSASSHLISNCLPADVGTTRICDACELNLLRFT